MKAIAKVRQQTSKAMKYLGSDEAVVSLKLAIAVVTLFQAVEAFTYSRRKIGFK